MLPSDLAPKLGLLADLFDPETRDRSAVWSKGAIISDYDPAIWRRDHQGNIIRYDSYGRRGDEYGWEIDHAHPTAFGGADTLANKRPLHWRVNAGLGGLLSGLLGGGNGGGVSGT